MVHNYTQKDVEALQTGGKGTTVEVQSYDEANQLLSEAFPDYQKVNGVGIKDAKDARKATKMKQFKKGGTYHKDYMGIYDEETGRVIVAGHDASDPHSQYPHINIKRRDGVKVLINIVGEILGFSKPD